MGHGVRGQGHPSFGHRVEATVVGEERKVLFRKALQASAGKRLSAGRPYSHVWWRPRHTGIARIQLYGFTQ